MFVVKHTIHVPGTGGKIDTDQLESREELRRLSKDSFSKQMVYYRHCNTTYNNKHPILFLSFSVSVLICGF
jgi:hypothetical protein